MEQVADRLSEWAVKARGLASREVSGGDAGIRGHEHGVPVPGATVSVVPEAQSDQLHVLLGQMFCNFGMECFDIADHAQEETDVI